MKPTMITVTVVETLQITKMIFKRLAADTLIEFILTSATKIE